jgi:calmodulin
MTTKARKNTVSGPRRENTAPDSRIRKNNRGGILVTPEEIKLAFEFLDCDKSGKVSLANLKKRLAVFFPEMSAKEYRFMMNNKREMTLQDFNDMLLENEVTNFDPVAEAFKVRSRRFIAL